MKEKVQKVIVLAVIGLLAALGVAQLPGCGGGGTAGPGSVGTLKVGLTDKASDAYQQVVVTIREVRVVPAGMENAADNDPGLPVVVSYATPQPVDILSLKFQQQILGSITLPAGTYNQVRLILEPNPNGQGAAPFNYLTLKTDPLTKIPMKTPSAQQSGLKVLGRFTVQAGVINAILLDFDPNTAIVHLGNGNGGYILKPTGIRIVQPTIALGSFGSLTGTIQSAFRDWSSATVSVVPPTSSVPIASGTVFSNYTSASWSGPFSAFVPGGSYRVHVRASGFAPYSSPVATVTAGAETALGTVPLVPHP
jgi:hypothetical protein